jgi:hypothetical protein
MGLRLFFIIGLAVFMASLPGLVLVQGPVVMPVPVSVKAPAQVSGGPVLAVSVEELEIRIQPNNKNVLAPLKACLDDLKANKFLEAQKN